MNYYICYGYPIMEYLFETPWWEKHDLQQIMLEKFEGFKNSCAKQHMEAGQIDSALYALAAFVDEVIMARKTDTVVQWHHAPMQNYYFNEHNAGLGFYQRLQQLMHAGSDYKLLQWYWFCLKCGFKGKYQLAEHQQQVVAIQQQAYEQFPIDEHAVTTVADSQVSKTASFKLIMFLFSLSVLMFSYHILAANIQASHLLDKSQQFLCRLEPEQCYQP